MVVMVVGGSGFIGSHLCAYLAAHQHRVIATTRRLEPTPRSSEEIEYRQLDLLGSSLGSLEFAGVDCVVYLAARTHIIQEVEDDPLAAFRRVNSEAALELARRAAAQGVARFIYLSSIGVNGISSERAFRETDTPRPVEAYAQSKLEAEQSLARCCAATGMQLVVLRPVLVYGRNAPGNFARLLNAVRAGRILPIGGFDNRRSLLAVENLVQLIELCMRHPQAANQVFLAADGDDVSTPELARLIGAAIGKPARLLHLPLGLLRPLARLLGKSRELERLCGSLQADIGKARSLLGWQPALSLRQALQKLCDVD